MSQVDHRPGSRVFGSVKPFFRPFLGLLLVAAAACGGKDKKVAGPGGSTGTVGPGAPGSFGSATDPANMDPEGGLEGIPAPTPNAGGQEPTVSEADRNFDPGPGVKPPGLDTDPAQRKAAVDRHLQAGAAALRGSTPDLNAAIAEAEAALQADETSVEAMVLLAHGSYLKGYYDLTEDVLKKALQRGGTSNKQAYFLLGLVYEKTERQDEAPILYQNALTLDPNYKSALINLGVHHLRNKRYADAVGAFERLTTELGVTSAAAWTNLASGYRGLAVEFQPTDITRRHQLVLQAEQTYRRAISADKNYANAYYNMGLLYLDADPFPEGQGEMDRLKRLKTAKTYLDEYRRLPGADMKLVDATAGVAQKLIEKEELLRKKQAEREAKQRAREAADKKGEEEFK